MKIRLKTLKLFSIIGTIGPFILYPIYLVFNMAGNFLLICFWPFSLFLLVFDNEVIAFKTVVIIFLLMIANIILFACIGYLIGLLCDLFLFVYSQRKKGTA